MPLSDLQALSADSIYCSVSAAARYRIPANLMLAVAESESGAPGLWSKNTNGTSDVGPMQFNTAYLATLSKYGITADAAAAPGCYPFQLAAWRLHRHLVLDQGDPWQRAANYHSRTPHYNARYRLGLIAKAERWAGWLRACAATSCLRSSSPAKTMDGMAPPPRRLQEAMLSPYVPRAITTSTASTP